MLGVDVTRLECNDCVHAWDAASRVFIEMPLWRSDGAGGDASTAMAATSCPASLVVFNFPHTTRPGKMAKLLMQMFRSLRCCIAAGKIGRDKARVGQQNTQLAVLHLVNAAYWKWIARRSDYCSTTGEVS